MTVSMTGYASRRGQFGAWTWTWDLRAVNGKGLDLRLRLPEWIEGLEPLVRAEVTRAATRGNLSLSLRMARDGGEEPPPAVNRPLLRAILSALSTVEQEAMAAGVTLHQASQAEVLGFRGVLDTAAATEDTEPLRAALMADLPALLAEFGASRAAEGAALAAVIGAQIDRIATLAAEARHEADARRDHAAQSLRENLARILSNAEGADETRVAQELALIAVRLDVTEELDRLDAHVAAARLLLADGAAVGRKFDFLMQEFMREANTLCSKSQSRNLTRLGLDLKTVIDQMREQVQNVE